MSARAAPLPKIGPLNSPLEEAWYVLDTLDGCPQEESGTRAELEERLRQLVLSVEALLRDPALTMEERDVDGIWRLLLHYDSQTAIAAREIKERQAQQRRAASLLERIETAVQASMEANGQSKLEGASTARLALQASPPSVVILDETLIPKEYKRHVPEQWEPDKNAIARALKAGVDVPGADLSEGNMRLVRK
jgi:PAS domain-containing protein